MPDNGGDEARSIEDLTLQELLNLKPDDFRDPSVKGGVEVPDFQDLQNKLAALPLPISWSQVQTEIAKMLGSALDANVLSLWTSAWEKYQGLMEDVEKSRESPKEVVLSALAEHSMESSLHPYLEVHVGPTIIQKISFDVTLTTTIKGLVLGIKKARIMSLQFAQCEWSGRIGIGDLTIAERELTKLSLPGRIEFKRGISLGSADKD